MKIGNEYWWDTVEGGWVQISPTAHERLQATRDEMHRKTQEYFVKNGIPMPKPIIVSTMADSSDDQVSHRELWEATAHNTKSGLIKYFKPAYQEPQFDQYGHAILPTGLREITGDAISAARLSFPKTEDEAFGNNTDT